MLHLSVVYPLEPNKNKASIDGRKLRICFVEQLNLITVISKLPSTTQRADVFVLLPNWQVSTSKVVQDCSKTIIQRSRRREPFDF